ncbi:MAG: YbhB/YbcL family Raf kinase inhibitor-like protein [Chloroflexi bacterium HGW-Chloroflexi-10]|nr:MAG: YbhB/YbcL family Raf kinase inhibitor-like protein [Chloroflexi bacterium HGW-Chloroflexi-10]
MHLSSPAFENGNFIPVIHTCEGTGESPELTWDNPPAGSVAFALVMSDPDVPYFKSGFVHWVIYNLPTAMRQLPSGITREQLLAIGAEVSPNGASQRVYYPPCPVNGTHHYVFRIYALDQKFSTIGKDRYTILKAYITAHTLAMAELTGLYYCTVMNDRQAFRHNILRMLRVDS